MAPCVREADRVKALPSTIWKTCIADMNWERWDEDVVRLEQQGDGGGDSNQLLQLREGLSFIFIMKEGPVFEIPVTVLNVKQNELVEYRGSVMYGLIKVWGKIEISPSNSNETATDLSRIKYSFQLSGFLGSISMWKNPTPVIHGTETGLANIVRMSEEAAATTTQAS